MDPLVDADARAVATAALANFLLHWPPLSAGGSIVRRSGRLIDMLVARREHRARPRVGRVPAMTPGVGVPHPSSSDLYRSPLAVRRGDRFVIEMAPVWADGRPDRDVVRRAPVGAALLGRSPLFR